jgi:DNA polymerase-4
VDVRAILHADMDAFYASIEQRDRPELRGRPVIVGGTSRRGVVMAASYEARPFGVRSAMPTAQARALCPHAVFLPGDMAKYRRVSAELRAVFASVSPVVEPLSLDEAFIDVTASRVLLGPPLAIGRLVKERVRAATALAVTVGIGPGKMVAKIASDLAKPDGLLEVPPDRVEAFLRPLGVGRLWGVGPVTEAALRGAGIATVGDLAARPVTEVAAVVGRAAAAHLVRLATGADVRAVEPDLGARSYGEEGTFGTDVRDDATVRGAILVHADAVARRLRRDGVRGRTVVLKLKLAERLGAGRFPLVTRRTTLREATDDGKTLSDAALRLWERHRPGKPVRLVGVTMAGIEAPTGQLGLFDEGAGPRRAALNRALDRIVERFGRESIVRGGARVEQGLTTRVKRGE